MVDHYDAFISYRHCPRDSKVAEEIQRSLEHFYLPKKIRQITGKKKIERIFRDKGELPVTSDLNDDIMFALLHSDFLIVICSADALESPWVAKEREFFLQHHPKNHILTVLSSGDPRDVVPKELCIEEQAFRMPDGSFQIVQKEIEPLSCDYRMPFQKARKIELPRLAAALLGCSYDELVQRQRQYAMRRMAVTFSTLSVVMAAALTYLFWSRARIEENLEQAKRNQSQYLAKESEKSLEENDRYSAVQLAIAALPGENEDRPVLPEARAALTKAVDAYKAPGIIDKEVEEEWTSVNRFEMDDEVLDFDISNDKWLIAYDERSMKAWNLENLQETYSYQSASDIKSVMFLSETVVLIAEDYGYPKAYDFVKQENVWENDEEYELKGPDDVVISGDRKKIAWASWDKIYILDAASGKIIQTIETSIFADDIIYKNYEFSEDGKKILIYRDDQSLYDESFAYIYDLDKKKSQRLRLPNWEEDVSIKAVMLKGDQLAVVGESVPDKFSYLRSEDVSEDSDLLLHSNISSKVQCVSLENGKLVWEKKLDYIGNNTVYLSSSVNEEMAEIFFPKNCFSILFGNDFLVLDADTGEKAQTAFVDGNVVSADQISWNGCFALCAEGESCRMCYSKQDGGYLFYHSQKEAGFSDAKKMKIMEKNGKIFLLFTKEGDTGISLFRTDYYDDAFDAFENAPEIKGEDICEGICGKYYVRILKGDFEDNEVDIYDVESRGFVKSIPISYDDDWNYSSLICSDNGRDMYLFSNVGGNKILRIQVENGETESYSVLDDISNVHIAAAQPLAIYGEKDKIHKMSLEDGTEDLLDVTEPSGKKMNAVFVLEVSQNGNYAIAALACPNGDEVNSELVMVNLNSGNSFLLEEGEDLSEENRLSVTDFDIVDAIYSLKITMDEENQRAAVIQNRNTVHVYDVEGKWKGTIVNPQEIESVYFYRGMLLVYSEHVIYRYNALDGKLLGKMTLEASQISDAPNQEEFDFENLGLNSNSAGRYRWDVWGDMLFLSCPDTLFMVQMDGWKQESEIPYAHYCKAQDAFVVRFFKKQGTVKQAEEEDGFGFGYEDERESVLGVFPHYTTEELLEKGRVFTQNSDIEDAKKEKYGIAWNITSSSFSLDSKELSVFTQGSDALGEQLESSEEKTKKQDVMTYGDFLSGFSESYVSGYVELDQKDHWIMTGFAISDDGKYGMHLVYMGLSESQAGFLADGEIREDGTGEIKYKKKTYQAVKYIIKNARNEETEVLVGDMGDGSKIIYSKDWDQKLEKFGNDVKIGPIKLEEIGKEETIEQWKSNLKTIFGIDMNDTME